MDLILWRHAEAEAGMPDLERALTAKGHKQARRMGEWLASQLPESCRILVSPALRTLQTAEALGRRFKLHAELAPGAEAEDVLKAANWPASKETVLIVGHQPTLGQTAALLLTGEEQDWEMRKAAAWWFSQREPGDPSSIYLKAVMAHDLVVK
ncbi:phosphohistidine phosphatase SixA [Janthinobacterium fluminis]|uniref:Phosphohistidine phosphatase SixA n=1 Tax=Janthinobacterium fluminis TaxID=2987524 RepID=A0ABT5JXL8_9BURK|nr:phosphohistidine phosphatase SixA [Janthinobacterium fluminis]MDC8756282.1 phosphohistidine phosphatase SixA [Janthinobacterium fluminis]